MGQIIAKAGAVIPFEVTAPPAKIAMSHSTPIRGRGWIDVHQIRILETGQALERLWK